MRKILYKSAIDEKSRIEKKFWNQIDREFENEEDKLLVILKNVISF